MSARVFLDAVFDPMRDSSAVAIDGRDGRSHRHSETDSCACGFASDATSGPAYNEEAFRYFLDVERKRSEISNRPFVLLLVDLKKESPTMLEMDAPSAQKVLSALSACVRETDFIGWYRTRSIAGAVLAQHSDTTGADVHDAVSRRIAQLLHDRLPSDLATLVRVRVYQLPAAAESVS
jgi:hypothetical protein